MKTTADVRLRLERAASISGRTLTQEVEHRVEQSFLFERVLGSLTERVKAATIQFLADTVDGPENLSAGIRIAQRLGFFSLPEQMDEAIEDVRRSLPKILARPPLPFGGKLSDLTDAALFDAAFAGPLPHEGREDSDPVLPEGLEWEKPENLHRYKKIDPEAELFRSVIAHTGTMDVSDIKDVAIPRAKRKYKNKS